MEAKKKKKNTSPDAKHGVMNYSSFLRKQQILNTL